MRKQVFYWYCKGIFLCRVYISGKVWPFSGGVSLEWYNDVLRECPTSKRENGRVTNDAFSHLICNFWVLVGMALSRSLATTRRVESAATVYSALPPLVACHIFATKPVLGIWGNFRSSLYGTKDFVIRRKHRERRSLFKKKWTKNQSMSLILSVWERTSVRKNAADREIKDIFRNCLGNRPFRATFPCPLT